jgi:effector-binding domain-containing protein
MLKKNDRRQPDVRRKNYMTTNDLSSAEPEILEMPPRKMATVYAKGTPEKVLARVLPDLYSSVHILNIEREKQGLSTFTVGGLRVRYPDAHLVPVTEWTNVIGIPIPETTSSLPQRVGGNTIKIETWEYGTVAQILHRGQHDNMVTTIKRLYRYISDNDYDIIGVHEEEHLGLTEDENRGILLRYRIMKKRAGYNRG